MTYNLVIGFRSTGIVEMKKRHKVYCVDSSLVHKILYFVNHITMIAVFAISVIVSIIAFSVWTLTRLCTDGSNVPKTMPVEGYKVGYNPGEIGQYLDLKEFAPLIHLRNNETIFLYFENDRLKIFCDDYVSMLYLYNLIYFAASMVVIYAFFNMILTYSFNISRNFTKTKCEELFYLSNASEMRTLNSNWNNNIIYTSNLTTNNLVLDQHSSRCWRLVFLHLFWFDYTFNVIKVVDHFDNQWTTDTACHFFSIQKIILK